MSETATRRRPWVAAALSVLFPGLGHAYLREWLRMAMWLALMITAVSVMIPPEIVPEEVTLDSMMVAYGEIPIDVSLAILALRTMNVVDAYVVGRRSEEQAAVAAGHQCPECGHELEDPSLSFCPWCAAELDVVATDNEDAHF